MARVSQRQRSIRRATRRVRIFTLLVSLEVSDSCDLDAIEGRSEEDVPFSVLLLLLEQRRLRTLIANRYLHMSRGFVPKSAEWGMYFLDALPEHRWRSVMRMGRSTYNLLTSLLDEYLNDSCAHGGKPISTDRVQKIALFRLGHYGNSASTLDDVMA